MEADAAENGFVGEVRTTFLTLSKIDKSELMLMNIILLSDPLEVYLFIITCRTCL